jgi:hypothetical protein
MKTLKQIKDILAKNKNELVEKFNVKEIGIFGSYVKGSQKKKSDLDILVEFKSPVGLFEFMDLEEYLKEMIGIDIDLVSKRALKPNIGRFILDEVVYV